MQETSGAPPELPRFAMLTDRTRSGIWQLSTDDPWIALLKGSRWICAGPDTWHLTEPADGYSLDTATSAYSGPPGSSGPTANTAVEFDGRAWAMVVPPLPDNDSAAKRLLMHEAWHAFGEPIAFAGMSLDERGGDDLLDTAPGRTWLRLELAALSAAIAADTSLEQRRHAACALAFHNRIRDLATADEIRRQHNLEISEGIAEFMSWKCCGARRSDWSRFIADLPPTGTAVRAFAYRTGAGWGFLLDNFRPSWREDVRSLPDLPALLALSIEPADAEACAEDYGQEQIAREESRRAIENERVIADLHRRFFQEPVLRLPFADGRFTFNPGGVTPVPGGTVYAPFTWTVADGARLTAKRGAFVNANHSELWVALEGAPIARGAGLQTGGDGWSLTLPENWPVDRDWRARQTPDE